MARACDMYTKTCKRDNTPGDAHYVTFSCYQRLPLLRGQRLCEWLVESIERAREKHLFDLWGYVFMPEHVHLLLWPTEKDYSISGILQSIKGPVAKHAIAHLAGTSSPLLADLQQISKSGRVQYHLWQAGGGYDTNLTSARAVHEALDYTHNNPLRRELVKTASDWPWSSYQEWWGPGNGPITVDKTLPTLMP